MIKLLRTLGSAATSTGLGLYHLNSSCLFCAQALHSPRWAQLPAVTCLRSTHLLPENDISLHSTTNRRKIYRKGESQKEDWAKDNLEKNIRSSGNTVIARNSITRSLAPPPCSREEKMMKPSGFKNPHICTLTYVELSSWGDPVPGEAVTST